MLFEPVVLPKLSLTVERIGLTSMPRLMPGKRGFILNYIYWIAFFFVFMPSVRSLKRLGCVLIAFKCGLSTWLNPSRFCVTVMGNSDELEARAKKL